MPIATIRGASINYEVVGSGGPWVALTPGGRRDLTGVQDLAERMAGAGFRVLLHDRRNCGASDVLLDSADAEYEVWADDLAELLRQVAGEPAFVGGSSAGCRLSLLVYLRHPSAVRGLLLWRVTGGAFAARRLAQTYYGQYLEATARGAMAAVCETEHFRDRIAANPANRERILSTPLERFRACFERWQNGFLESADLPVIGATEADLRGVRVPVCVIPGNDNTHPRAVGENAARLMPRSELHVLFETQHDLDISPAGEQEAMLGEQARLFVEFIHKHAAVTA